jgi:hypothetical protein
MVNGLSGTIELMNFSIYDCDIARFDHSWDALRRYWSSLGLGGVELLIGFHDLPQVDASQVKGVHLPYCIDWFGVWSSETDVPEWMPEEEMRFYTMARDREGLHDMLALSLRRAATVSPAYGVMHASSVSLDEMFVPHRHTDREVLEAFLEWVNSVVSTFPGGEPPVRMLFENLWWPGLNLRNGLTAWFMDRLEFDNWGLLLDTGHLMNSFDGCVDEEDAIDLTIDLLSSIPDVVERMEAVHLHCSTSGEYRRERKEAGEPEGFASMSLKERIGEALRHFDKVDEHSPFSSPRAREILDLVGPGHLTHEFPSYDLEDLSRRLRRQTATLRGGMS